MIAYTPLTPDLISQLTAIVGVDNISTSDAERKLHSRDASFHPEHAPDVVVWATDAEQISAMLAFANQHRIPVTPWGVGTSLEGNPLALRGGILLSFERMNRIIEVHADDFQVTVEPGIGHKDLNTALARHGLFFPPDPGANATIGGMLANNAAGIRTVKYGASKDNVLKMQVALADGRLIEVGSRSIKQSSGYDLLHLFVGSEGTLGVITRATLKLVPVPQFMSAVVASFLSVSAAVETVVAVRGSGLDPAALELIDAAHAKMLSEAEGIELGDQPTLFMEFHAAHELSLAEGLRTAEEICLENGASWVRSTTDPTERKKLWHARHSSYEILVRTFRDQKFYVNDVAVPISRYPELITYIEEVREREAITAYMIGHAGDGNIHVELLFHDDATYKKALDANAQIVTRALELGGTATGEHGVGIGKARFMAREHGEALNVMRSIKQTLDPNGILNPGKIFPE